MLTGRVLHIKAMSALIRSLKVDLLTSVTTTTSRAVSSCPSRAMCSIRAASSS